jgi:hypothetical protein
VPPDRRTPPVSGSSRSRAPSLALSLPSWTSLSAPVTSPALSPSLSLFRGPGSPALSRCARPLFSLCTVDLPCQFHLPRARRGPARAHSRTSSGFSATTPAHAPSSLFRAPRTPLTSFCTASPSLALCPRLQPPPETHARVPGHRARRIPL